MVTKQHFKNNIFVVLFDYSYSLLIVLNEKKTCCFTLATKII